VRSRRGRALLDCDPVGPRERGARAELGQKQKGEKNPFLFFFSKFSKHFQMILNPLLNLNQTTQYKNSNATA
jgi:hypothetical protein